MSAAKLVSKTKTFFVGISRGTSALITAQAHPAGSSATPIHSLPSLHSSFRTEAESQFVNEPTTPRLWPN